jgi:hypothetical protein
MRMPYPLDVFNRPHTRKLAIFFPRGPHASAEQRFVIKLLTDAGVLQKVAALPPGKGTAVITRHAPIVPNGVPGIYAVLAFPVTHMALIDGGPQLALRPVEFHNLDAMARADIDGLRAEGCLTAELHEDLLKLKLNPRAKIAGLEAALPGTWRDDHAR